MTSRAGLRLLQARTSAFARHSTGNTGFTFRRNASTTAEGATEGQTGFAKLWNSPVGPKTVHFWAPIMKWGLVIAGAADMVRPAEKLSLNTNAALMMTGAIWTRWCLIIKPKNVFLATVNAFLFCVGATQVTRILLWRRSEEGQAALAAEKTKDTIKDAAKHPVEAVKAATS